MEVRTIKGATNFLGAPPDWDRKTHGECGTLPIRREVRDGLSQMVSAWSPTPEELQRLNAGALIELTIIGGTHPPVMLSVSEPVPATSHVQKG